MKLRPAAGDKKRPKASKEGWEGAGYRGEGRTTPPWYKNGPCGRSKRDLHLGPGRDLMALRPGDLAVRRRSCLAGVGRQARHLAGGSKPAAREAPAPLGRAAGKLASVPGERRAGARRGRRSSPRLPAEGSGGERAAPQEVGAAMPWPRGGRGIARRGLPRLSQAHRAAAQRQQPPPPNPMSQPGVLAGPSRPVPAITPLLRAAAAATGGTTAPAAATAAGPSEEGSPAPPNTAAGCLSSRLLLFLGVLQICLGCTIVALDFGALSLGSSSQVKNACPFWAGSSVSHRRGPAPRTHPPRPGRGSAGRAGVAGAGRAGRGGSKAAPLPHRREHRASPLSLLADHKRVCQRFYQGDSVNPGRKTAVKTARLGVCFLVCISA